VGWRFEHEAARRVAILQVLEKPTVKFVNWAHVLSLQPGSIGGNVVHRGELIAHKGVAHDRNALLRKVGGDWMNFPKFRSQKMKAAESSLRSLDPTLLPERWRWRRKHYSPGRWDRECLVVLREKAMQQRRPRAWESNDEDWGGDLFFTNPRPGVAVALNL
jgi:hypothetical protein